MRLHSRCILCWVLPWDRVDNSNSCGGYMRNPVVATSHIRSEKQHLESVMIVAKQAQRANFLNG